MAGYSQIAGGGFGTQKPQEAPVEAPKIEPIKNVGLNDGVKKELASLYNDDMFKDENNIQDYIFVAIEDHYKDADEDSKIDASLLAEDFLKKLRKQASIIDGDDFKDVSPKMKEHFKSKIMSNAMFYDEQGNFNSEGISSALGDKTSKSLNKLYHRLDDVMKIKGQQELYDSRNMSGWETAGRVAFPNAYDAEGALATTFQGGVDAMEGFGRLATAGVRSVKDDVDFLASATAPSSLRTDEEQIAQGILSTTTPITGVAKLTGKAVAKSIGRKTAAKIGSMVDELPKRFGGKAYEKYKRGADVIDIPGSNEELQAAEKMLNAKTASTGDKLFTNVVREGSKEALPTGAYVGTELTKDGDLDDNAMNAIFAAMGGGLSTIVPIINKTRGTGVQKMTDALAKDLSPDLRPFALSKKNMNDIIKRMRAGNQPLTAEAVADEFKREFIPKLLKSNKTADQLTGMILDVSSDIPSGLSPREMLFKVKSGVANRIKKQASDEGGVYGTTESRQKLMDEFNKYFDELRGASTLDIKLSSKKGKELKKGYENLEAKKKEYIEQTGEELDATEIPRESASSTQSVGDSPTPISGKNGAEIEAEYSSKSADGEDFSSYVRKTGTPEEKKMLLREKRFKRGGLEGESGVTTPTLRSARQAERKVADDIYEAKKQSDLGQAPRISDKKLDMVRQGIHDQIDKEISKVSEDAAKTYQLGKDVSTATSNFNIKNMIKRNGEVDTAKLQTWFNGAYEELSNPNKIHNHTAEINKFANSIKRISEGLKSAKLPEGKFSDASKVSRVLGRQIEDTAKQLMKSKDAIVAQKLIIKMDRLKQYYNNVNSNVYKEIYELIRLKTGNKVRAGKGLLKSALHNFTREFPKGQVEGAYEDSKLVVDDTDVPELTAKEKALKIKSGNVDVDSLSPKMKSAATKASGIISGFVGGGYEPTVTSGKDSKHMKGSKHYEGNGIDFRSKDMFAKLSKDETATKLNALSNKLKKQMGGEFDVVLEGVGTPNEHIHIEYDPK